MADAADTLCDDRPTGADPSRHRAAALTDVPQPPSALPADPDARLSPLVRRLLHEHQLDPASVHGTGEGGRICRDDVLRAAQAAVPTVAHTRPTAATLPSRFVRHDTMRRRIAEHMVDSLLRTAPHVTSIFEADFSAILAHQKAHRGALARQGIKLTLTAYFVAASCRAISAEPSVNARFHPDGIEYFTPCNIAIVTALGDRGLVAPVIRDADQRSLSDIARQLQRLTDDARAGSLALDDVRNGTFTLSNHGISGSLVATPIVINQPQSAVLGIGKLEKRVCVVEHDGEDRIEIRPRAFITLTIDHRVMDAVQTNRFLAHWVDVIEHWPAD